LASGDLLSQRRDGSHRGIALKNGAAPRRGVWRRRQLVKRWHLVELEDLPLWSRLFRDAATDYLVTALRHAKIYDKLVPRLATAIKQVGATQITDLCSGGGGPWPDLFPALRAAGADGRAAFSFIRACAKEAVREE